MKPFSLPATLLVAALTVAAACSDDDDGLRADTESIDSSRPQEGGSTTGDGNDGNGNDDSSDGDGGEVGNGGGSGEVLGTTRAQLPTNAIDSRSTPVRIDIIRLERNGDLIEAGFILTNEVDPEADTTDPQEYQANDMFGDGMGNYDASGFGLVDGEAQKIYLPVRDSEGQCLCTDGFGANETPPGGTLNIDATFGGVPDDVERVDIRIPNFPTITGVPIQ